MPGTSTLVTPSLHNFSQGSQCIPGVVTQTQGPVSYMMMLDNGQAERRDVDHLQVSFTHENPVTVSELDEDDLISVQTTIDSDSAFTVSGPA